MTADFGKLEDAVLLGRMFLLLVFVGELTCGVACSVGFSITLTAQKYIPQIQCT